MDEAVIITINGQRFGVAPGTTAAAAILEHHGLAFKTSVQGEPRGPVCGMGTCYECRVQVDGMDGVRSCMTTCRDGMEIRTG